MLFISFLEGYFLEHKYAFSAYDMNIEKFFETFLLVLEFCFYVFCVKGGN